MMTYINGNIGGIVATRGGVSAIAPVRFDGTFKPIDDWLGNSRNLETAICVAMSHSVDTLLSEDGRNAFGGWAGNPDGLLYKGDATHGFYISGRVMGTPANITDEDRSFCAAVMDALAHSMAYVLDLVLCFKVSELAESNIKSYFMDKDRTAIDGGKVLKLMLFVYKKFPDLTASPAVMAALVNNPFMRYHTVASSTPALMTKVITDLGAESARYFSPAEIAAVAAAQASPTNLTLTNAISFRSIAVAGSFLDAYGFNFGSWYQLKRAVSMCPAGFYDTCRSFFQKRRTLSASTDGIVRAATLDELMNAIPAGMGYIAPP